MASIEIHPLAEEATGDVKLDTLRAFGTLGALCESLDGLDADDPLSELDRIGIVRTMALLLYFLARISSVATFYIWSRDLPFWELGRNAFVVQMKDGRVLGWSRGADDAERERRVLMVARDYFSDDDLYQSSHEAAPTVRILGVAGDAGGDELVCEIVAS
jgi:hypothetical protein